MKTFRPPLLVKIGISGILYPQQYLLTYLLTYLSSHWDIRLQQRSITGSTAVGGVEYHSDEV